MSRRSSKSTAFERVSTASYAAYAFATERVQKSLAFARYAALSSSLFFASEISASTLAGVHCVLESPASSIAALIASFWSPES